MRRITSRIAAALGAAMILACALPTGARAQGPVPRPRAEAQWLERRAAARRMLRWQAAHPRLTIAWRRGYARGFAAARRPYPAARWQRAYRGRLYGRFIERRRLGRMGGRWSI